MQEIISFNGASVDSCVFETLNGLLHGDNTDKIYSRSEAAGGVGSTLVAEKTPVALE